MGAEFLVSGVKELHIHTLIRAIWEFPCVSVNLYLLDLPSVYQIFSHYHKKNEVEKGVRRKGEIFLLDK